MCVPLCSINAYDAFQVTALIWAAQNGHLSVINMLVAAAPTMVDHGGYKYDDLSDEAVEDAKKQLQAISS